MRTLLARGVTGGLVARGVTGGLLARGGMASIVALAAAVPALAAEGGPIRGGEHDGFTRIVLEVAPTTEWSLETEAGRAGAGAAADRRRTHRRGAHPLSLSLIHI